jgi:hypothetical protein
MLGTGLDTILLFVLPCIAGMTGVHHCVQTLVEMEFKSFFPGLSWNRNPPDLCLLSD